MYMYGKLLLDRSKEVYVIIKTQVRMKPALHEYLCAAAINGFFYFIKKLSFPKYVRVRCVLVPVKRAEPAFVNADVGIVDIPVNDKAYIAL